MSARRSCVRKQNGGQLCPQGREPTIWGQVGRRYGEYPDFTRWVYDALCSNQPYRKKFKISVEHLGDFETLQERLHAEVAASNTVVPWLVLVGA